MKCFCPVPFLTWGLEATSYPVLEICYCWCISAAAKSLAVSFWRWTWTSLNSDYRTALTRSTSMLTGKLKLVCVLLLMMMGWFWEQWRKHCNFSKILEKGGKQSWSVQFIYESCSGVQFDLKKKTYPESSLRRKIREYVFKMMFRVMNLMHLQLFKC